MAIESHDELEYKIAELENKISKVEDQEHPNEGDLTRMKLEMRRLKNLKGDEGVHPAAEVTIPKNLTAVSPEDHLKTHTLGRDDKGETLADKGMTPAEANDQANAEIKANQNENAGKQNEKQTRANPTATASPEVKKA